MKKVLIYQVKELGVSEKTPESNESKSWTYSFTGQGDNVSEALTDAIKQVQDIGINVNEIYQQLLNSIKDFSPKQVEVEQKDYISRQFDPVTFQGSCRRCDRIRTVDKKGHCHDCFVERVYQQADKWRYFIRLNVLAES